MQEISPQQLLEDFRDEINFYVDFRGGIDEYVEATSHEQYKQHVLSYFAHYPEFYDLLGEEVFERGMDLDSPEYFKFYEEFTIVYFNYVDEVLYLVSQYNAINDFNIGCEQVLTLIHPDDITYSIYIQLYNKESEFKVISDVSRGFILQALRNLSLN